MASYIQGITDYVPQIQPFQPNYQFYSNALNIKQSKYDVARKQLSDLYGSLLNSSLTRDDNVKTRDDFFKTIEQDIQKMAGLDLSLAQNQEAAAGIFDQLLDNKAIRKDMIFTKNYENQLQRAEGFRNCKNPDECGGAWWEGGERLLAYNKEEFRTASASEAMRIGNAKFVPYQDLTKKAMLLAKEADLNVSMDQVTGQWITTTKNGPLIVGALSDLFTGVLGNDPAIQDYYRAKAQVTRKDYVYQNTQKYGSKEAAEMAYIKEMAPIAERYLYGASQEIEDKALSTRSKKDKLNEKLKNSLPYERTEMEELRDQFQAFEGAYQNSAEFMKDAEGNVTVAYNNRNYTGDEIDNMLMSISLQNDIKSSAGIMAYRNYEVKQAVNPYGLEEVRFRNSMLMEEFKAYNQQQLEKFKQDYAQEKKDKESKGYLFPNQNTPEAVIVPGSLTKGSDDLEDPSVATRGYDAFVSDRNKIANSSSEFSIIEPALGEIGIAADNGDAQAKEDYVTLITQAMNAAPALGENNTSNNTIAEFKQAMSKAYNTNDKYAIAKKYGNLLPNMTNTQMSTMYETLDRMMDSSKTGNRHLRDYLQDNWDNSIEERRAIKAKNAALVGMDKQFVKMHNNVISRASNEPGYDKKTIDGFRSYVDENGKIVNKETFVKNMVTRGYRAEEVIGMYDGSETIVETPGLLDRMFGESSPFNTFGVTLKGNAQNTKKQNSTSIASMYQKAFTQWAKPEGLGVGDKYTTAGRYTVDSKAYKSIASIGAASVLAEVMNEGTIAEKGYFRQTLDGIEDDSDAKQILQTLYQDMITNGSGEDRPIFQLTYSDIAGRDINKVAVNIKLSPKYAEKYKVNTDKGTGLIDDITTVTEQGITVYMDRNKTKNLFTTKANRSPEEVLMDWGGKIEYDSYPQYQKGLTIKKNSAGGYTAEGSFRTGLDESGNPIFRPHYMNYPNQNITAVTARYDQLLRQLAIENKQIDNAFKLKGK